MMVEPFYSPYKVGPLAKRLREVVQTLEKIAGFGMDMAIWQSKDASGLQKCRPMGLPT